MRTYGGFVSAWEDDVAEYETCFRQVLMGVRVAGHQEEEQTD